MSVKNAIMIMSGGVGNRFGADVPKQYTLLKGVPTIDYVIKEAKKSKVADKIIVVIDPFYEGYTEGLKDSELEFAPNGKERLDSVKSGFDYITEHYPECEGVIILDAVAPLVTGELIDDYLTKLREYDAVITCQNFTGALGNYEWDPLDRTKFYMTQSPEAFRLKSILKNFSTMFPSQELAWQMDRETTKYLNFDFKHNHKLTFDFDAKYLEYLMEYFGND